MPPKKWAKHCEALSSRWNLQVSAYLKFSKDHFTLLNLNNRIFAVWSYNRRFDGEIILFQSQMSRITSDILSLHRRVLSGSVDVILGY